MSKRKKIALYFAWVFAIFAGTIEVLEILSRTCDCSSSRTTVTSAPMQACDNHPHADDVNLKNY